MAKTRKPKNKPDLTQGSLAGVDEQPGPDTGGQSGDTQGLSDVSEADSESVKELVEEGQFREAEIIDSIENAPDPDEREVRTREVPDDDVPPEYLREEKDTD